ncbi:plant intracellular Ras-group-related LRR protein 8-like isoform X1 [Zingiber officinale]|uniref:plant intracellular Ras-group-related LRR protein 8-like isoform X1 n=1 Tax=Zingiber officinale TaxID=94328 RepID=UPI001C4C6D28|nr:plant intracellular Ras-group-related LRR protein 8-like isoform X1 [Zingiber officinale]
MEASKEVDGGPSTMTVHVKFTGRTLPVSLQEDATVNELKSLLQPLTNVLPRGQTLIFKGRVLTDKMSLKSVPVSNGSKLMLIASQGLHQGDGPITKDSTSQTANSRRILDAKKAQVSHTKTFIEKSRSEKWKLTGVVALSECHLEAVPEEVWSCESSIRVLDISNNLIREVPTKVGLLQSLNKLLLNANNITDDSISWEGLSSLKSLTVLSINQNCLTMLPSTVGTLTSLCQLHLSYNKITSLPDELGSLNKLEILKVANNRLSSIPSIIGNCKSLVEIDLSCNLLVDLPETVGNLLDLKVLILRNNGLKSLPSALFKMCTQLSTLDLHGTQITNDSLRQIFTRLKDGKILMNAGVQSIRNNSISAWGLQGCLMRVRTMIKSTDRFPLYPLIIR